MSSRFLPPGELSAICNSSYPGEPVCLMKCLKNGILSNCALDARGTIEFTENETLQAVRGTTSGLPGSW